MTKILGIIALLPVIIFLVRSLSLPYREFPLMWKSFCYGFSDAFYELFKLGVDKGSYDKYLGSYLIGWLLGLIVTVALLATSLIGGIYLCGL